MENRAHILIVDDMPPNIRLVRAILKDQYMLSVATSGEEALLIAAKYRPDLILLDVEMPGMDGYETCTRLKGRPETSAIPVLFLTAKSQTEHMVEGFEVGGADYISKPFEAVVLLKRVSTHLQNYLYLKQEQRARKESENNLETSQAQLQMTSEEKDRLLKLFNETQKIAQVGSWCLDLVSGELIWSNEMFRLLEIDQNKFEASSEGFLNAIHPEDRERVDRAHAESLASGEEYEVTHRLLMPDQRIKWLIQRGCSEYNDAGEPTRSQGMILEITNQKETELELEKAIEAKDNFLATMSHELRTPLTSIIGNSGNLLEDGHCGNQHCPQSDATEILRSIEHSGRAQLALVNDILDMSRIESGKFTIDEALYSLSRLLEGVVKLLSAQIQDAGLKFIVDQQNVETHLLIGDEKRIEQILLNLIGNAIKFTAQGSISLQTRVESGQLIFTVTDTGIGMPTEILNQLFGRFKQADGSISRRFGGSGLGLYISLNLAKLMSGTINVTSVEGEGSEFELVLPYRRSDHPEQPLSPHDAETKHSAQKAALTGHVLIAEDTPALRLLEQRILEKMGLTVTAATNGKEAVDQARSNQFDLILMDMQMPEMDGIEATKVLRAEGNQVPIIALTANVMQKHREQFDEAGCDDFVAKPIDKELLSNVLRKYL